MTRRYAYGISSGGFNSSRMAVTFNSGSGNADTWKALLEHSGGHELTADMLGATGVKAWFDPR